MRVGITTIFKGSAFGGALPQVALYLARALKAIGHEVEFIVPADSASWFIDCQSLKETIPVISLQNGAELKTYSLVIEVVWFLPDEVRRQLAQKIVMFYHYPPVFYDIENSVYPISALPRTFNGIHAVWTWSHHDKTDINYLELLTRVPVFTLPFAWDPCLLDSYTAEADVPVMPSLGNSPTAVVCESNESNSSQCTLPLTILSEIRNAKGRLSWTVLNSEVISTREYFKQNILKNLHLSEGTFLKRIRLPDLCREPNVIVSHQRFRPIKYLLLDALYMGIPLIHNCEMLAGIPGAEFSYTLNRIGQAVKQWDTILAADPPSQLNLMLTREALLKRWGPDVTAAALPSLIERSMAAVKIVPLPKATLRIAFKDMWADFKPAHNLFLEALRQHGPVELNQEDPTLIIFGPFGKENEGPRWANIPKVFYTGENLPPLQRRDVVLNIGFKRGSSEGYLRFPNWMLELNWYNQDAKAITNPEPFALSDLNRSVTTRGKFCAFVASNPRSVERNTLYHLLSRYKTVDSAGALFNNCKRIEGGPGGSGGQVAKVEFYKGYRFALVCENSSDPGYVTEKILHAKLAGCVPIYWGDSELAAEFETAGVIQARNFKSEHELLERIKAIDESETLWLELASKPLLDESRLVACRDLLKRLAERVLAANMMKAVPVVPVASAVPATVPVSTETNVKRGFNIITPESAAAAAPMIAPETPLLPPSVASAIPGMRKMVQMKIGPYEPYKQEFCDSGPQAIVTCCNGLFVKSAIRLIKSSPLPVYVWVWEISADDKTALEAAGAAKVIPFDTAWNPNWKDFWNRAHYAWKPLLLVLANAVFPKGTQVLYLDSGIEICNSLGSVWSSIAEQGIYVVHMPEHQMKTWSHPTFCSMLNLTPQELAAPQYSANIVGFEAGGRFNRMFTECLSAACQPDIISGHKWHQYSAECFGHRHDQSILSLFGFRNGVKPVLHDDVVGLVSQHNTRYNGRLFYVHRQIWKGVQKVVDGIDEAFVVNLAHRSDRLERFWKEQPYMKGICYREDAVYGNELKMTPELAHLFRSNDFKWKKGVIGCALSHYNIWKRLRDDVVVSSYLVLEDDAVLDSKFLQRWQAISPLVPKDADVIFLGGVLPPNKKALPLVTEPVNQAFARVKKHNLFGGTARRYFHFCTYSYVITKSGVEKLCKLIDERGIFTSIDHMMVNHGDGLLNIYFTTPLLAGCFQDSDPIYQNANFNDFDRVDKFDSEIWNNKACFTEAEIKGTPVAPVVAAPVAAVAAVASDVLPIVYFEPHVPSEAIDSEWLESIFQRRLKWTNATDAVAAGTTVLVYYQHTTPIATIEGWINRHMDCKLHLYHASDEACKADTSLYNHPGIKTVFRNYWRPDVEGPKVVHLPLGYLNGKGRGDRHVAPISKRRYTWSFAGAIDRPDRSTILNQLKAAVPNCSVHTTPTWKSPLNLDETAYRTMLQESCIVPCLNGFYNVESYRFYEALENGALPIIPMDKLESYKNLFSGSVNPPLLGIADWKTVGQVMTAMSTRLDVLDKIQGDMWLWWSGYKDYLRGLIRSRLV